jgi:hypothetical protein
MFWLGRIWRWGVVVPATLAAFAGAIADVVTDTVAYWYLLAPSYFVIAISVWNELSIEAAARRRADRLAAESVDEGRPPEAQPSLLESNELARGAAADDAIVATERQVSAFTIVGGLGRGLIRVVATFGITLFCMVLIWMAIGVATWARGYWYIYGPVLAGIAWLIWAVVRSGPADKADVAAPAETLVR